MFLWRNNRNIGTFWLEIYTKYLQGSIAQSVVHLTADPGGHKFKFQLSNIPFIEIEWLLSLTGKSMFTKYWLEEQACLGKVLNRLTD